MSRTRLQPAIRKEEILQAAVKLAEDRGYNKLSCADIAEHTKISESLVRYYWGTMKQFRRALMRHAIHTENLTVIAQGMCMNDALVRTISPKLRSQVAIHITG